MTQKTVGHKHRRTLESYGQEQIAARAVLKAEVDDRLDELGPAAPLPTPAETLTKDP